MTESVGSKGTRDVGRACRNLATLGLMARSAEQAEPRLRRAIEAIGCDPVNAAGRAGLAHASTLLDSAAMLTGDLDQVAAPLEEAHRLRDVPEPYGAPVRAMLTKAYEQLAAAARTASPSPRSAPSGRSRSRRPSTSGSAPDRSEVRRGNSRDRAENSKRGSG